MENRRVRVIITGRVQGVFFRASTREMAVNKGLKGWVRNLPDGNVEALFEGPGEMLEEAVSWCRHGPRGASVADIQETWGKYSGKFDRFEIRY
ncbi:MAG: acylphosphatase [Nitrospiraceae bacterium]|nr:MAG: acylphosphatase [Nitrospiraceae bacterium]